MSERDDGIVEAIPRHRKIAYGALLFGVGLLLAEVGMRVTFFLKEDLAPTPDVSLEYEWKWAGWRLARGSAAFIGKHEYDADLGWRLVANYEEDGIRTNAQGLRADREYPPGRQPGRRRIVLLGDSFTFGALVANHETFAHFLEHEQLPGWDVINLAVSGYGTDQALLAYEQRSAELAADVVVMGFYVRDYYRNLMRFLVYAKPYFELDGDGLRLTQHPVIPPATLYEEYANGSRRISDVDAPYLVLSLAKAWRRLRERRPSESDAEWQVLSRLMRRFRDHVRAQGAEPLWLVIPKRDVVEVERNRYTAIEEMCEREAQASGLSVLRVDGAFRAHAARNPDVPLYRPRDVGGHLSVDGHRVVAASLANHLRSEGLIERSPN